MNPKECPELTDYYLFLIERIREINHQFCSGSFVHYPTIHQNLIQSLHLINMLITLEKDHSSFLIICQQKEQLTLSLHLIEKLLEQENRTVKSPEKINETIPTMKGLNEIIGLSEIKKALRTAVLLPRTQPQLFTHFKPGNIILLYGPPGTGKTLLVHALAAEVEAKLHTATAGDILSHYVGETEKTIKALFQQLTMNSTLSILFIDEIDALCRRRRDSEQEHTRRIKTELMCEMSNLDNCTNFLICATNCPWELDPAILRRFQKRLYVPLPDKLERLEYFQKLPLDIESDWEPLIQKTEGYSGSDLANVIETAMSLPLSELEDTKIWVPCTDGFYEPVTITHDYSNVVCCNFGDLPCNSVRARKTCYNDLLHAIETVKNTVSTDDLLKYEQFHKGVK